MEATPDVASAPAPVRTWPRRIVAGSVASVAVVGATVSTTRVIPAALAVPAQFVPIVGVIV